MPTLETIPTDLKYLILIQLEELRTLKALCKAVPGYSEILYHHPSIKSTICRSDVRKYEMEASWIDSYIDTPTPVKKHDLEIALNKYAIGYKGISKPAYITAGQNTRDIEARVSNRHRHVYDFYEAFVACWFRGHPGLPPPSASEESRIVKAIYQTWIAIILAEKPNDGFTASLHTTALFECLDFWDNVAVWGVLQYLYRKIYKRVMANMQAMNHAGVLKCFNSRSVPESDISILCLVYGFPEGIIDWIQDDALDAIQVTSRVTEVLSRFPNKTNPGAWMRENLSNMFQITYKSNRVVDNTRPEPPLELDPQPGTGSSRPRYSYPEVLKRDRYLLVTYHLGVETDLLAYVWDERRIEMLQLHAPDLVKVDGMVWSVPMDYDYHSPRRL
ncbi:hypothetical protein H072_9075 [Dactylellina haptotyla CBS 200.50]|uniref:Uncharacterized protein n=1 Tax=Dactylellina haptotyla (strain CBS 200.50) TaxID=1284197 RepID=S8A3J8_DACHA|nr:hypothetical protein H072_9075 [Dactylellina haptotyla CBS 200.50]